MKVFMTGGGTGGHVNPAIAIADCIKENQKDSEIVFVGTARGIENKLAAKAGYPIRHVEIRGLKRSLSLSNIKTAYYVLTAPGKAKKLIKEFKPDIVVGTGGYVCWPVLKAAAAMGIPTALHESNAVPGVAVKLLENKVDRIFVNFESTKEFLSHPEKVMRVGNPLRSDFLALSTEQARERLGIAGRYKHFILSCGGSLGAERVNDMVLQLMKDYTAKHPDVYHMHACGSIEKEACFAKFKEMGLEQYSNIELVEYIYDMPLRMAAADLVINRAGAMTLSELAVQKKPCVLIPSPNVTNNHQFKNASALEKEGAAIVFEERDITAEKLLRAVASILDSDEKRRSMAQAIGQFALTDAKKRIYQELCRLVEEKEK
ncbi:MAG: undecaprenyldiphospho-muramoylpentapeptide beta-N-acetylglucosaminyltransferase [Clostridiales bacterium]|nr:undecaprenyldiphospho-muramoylpentapeptide beta-N-acetylglucosaminyltransferase [Clostridiales bacterium]